MKALLAMVLVQFLVVFCAVQAQETAEEGITASGFQEMLLPGTNRRYTLVIPQGYSGEVAVPLVVSLHYGGRVTPFYGRGLLETLIEPALRELGAIFIAPDSAADDWANFQAEEHVIQLLDHVMELYSIDASKTLLTGYSMGGRGTWYLAARHQDRFKAALPIAGSPETDSGSIDWQIPLYVIHGALDRVIPLGPSQAVVNQLKSSGKPIEFIVLDGVSHYEIPQYGQHLAKAIPWVKEAWNE